MSSRKYVEPIRWNIIGYEVWFHFCPSCVAKWPELDKTVDEAEFQILRTFASPEDVAYVRFECTRHKRPGNRTCDGLPHYVDYEPRAEVDGMYGVDVAA